MAAFSLVALLVAATSLASPVRDDAKAIARIEIDGTINPATLDYIESSIDEAAAQDAVALVIRLDTPGGLLSSAQDIVKAILASPLPIIVHVAPGGAGATSAGVFVTMAAHIAVMATGTTIGAAHPVEGGGGDIGKDMRAKVENFTVSFVESIAQRRGRNVEWAAKAVRESVSITEQEAAKLKVIDFVADDLTTILERAEGREVEVAGSKRKLAFADAKAEDGTPRVTDIPMTLRQRVLQVVADPNVAYLLMMAGMLGLYLELSTPGAVLPGVAGVICLLLALLASQVLPINSTGALLVMVGFAFLIAEVFVPSFGVLGFGGLLALTLGSLFLYTPESQLAVDRSLIAVTTIFVVAAGAAIGWLLLGDRRRPAATGAEGLVGTRGTAVSAIGVRGKVKVRGELWNARSVAAIEKGRPVRVRSVDGLELLVEEEAGRKEL